MNSIEIVADRLSHPPVVYSHGVRAGDFIFVAGQVGIDYTTGTRADDFETQARQAFENLSIVLQAAGSSMQWVVKMTVWLCDAANFDALNKLYHENFPVNPPARSTPVICLPVPGLHLSIEAVAAAGI